MSVSDPIADMLTSLRNATMARKDVVEVPHSNVKEDMARILKREGFITDYTSEGGSGKKSLRLYLKYGVDQDPVVRGLKRISKPGRRHFVNVDDLPRVLGGIGIAILSTSHGLLTDREARQANTGGEVLCYIW